jgi:hypothetical protein
VPDLRALFYYGFPLLSLLVLLLVVWREGRPSVTAPTVFVRRVVRAGHWRHFSRLWVLSLVVPGALIDLVMNPRPFTAYLTPGQWAAGVASTIVVPGCVLAFVGVMPKLRREGKVITLERVDASTIGFHVRHAGGRMAAYHQVDDAPIRSALRTIRFLQRHGARLSDAGWSRLELVSPEIADGALEMAAIEALLKTHLPHWYLVAKVDRAYPRRKALAYWLAKKPRRWPGRARGVVLEFRTPSNSSPVALRRETAAHHRPSVRVHAPRSAPAVRRPEP